LRKRWQDAFGNAKREDVERAAWMQAHGLRRAPDEGYVFVHPEGYESEARLSHWPTLAPDFNPHARSVRFCTPLLSHLRAGIKS